MTQQHALDDLESDIRHLAVLVETVTEMVIDHPTMRTTGDFVDHLNRVGALLWIARDLTSQLVLSAADASARKPVECAA